jgi:hypothetical protein
MNFGNIMIRNQYVKKCVYLQDRVEAVASMLRINKPVAGYSQVRIITRSSNLFKNSTFFKMKYYSHPEKDFN